MPNVDKAEPHLPLVLITGAQDQRQLNQRASWLDGAKPAVIVAATVPFCWPEGLPHRGIERFVAAAMPPPDALAAMMTYNSSVMGTSGL